jgi:transcriptional regulator with XRE-family HTH domain
MLPVKVSMEKRRILLSTLWPFRRRSTAFGPNFHLLLRAGKRPVKSLAPASIHYINLTEIVLIDKLYVMPKASTALSQMPPSTVAALQQLGADLAVARLRRKESLKTWAKRIGVSVPTLLRLEAGEPSVSLGVLATALWLVGRDGALATLATPREDRGALELDVREAESLGRERVRATAQAKMARAAKQRDSQP